MPFTKQQLGGTRYYVYNNIRHDGNRLICEDAPYSILAPQLSGIKAPAIHPFDSTPAVVCEGFPTYNDEVQHKPKPNRNGRWSLVPKTNMYPDLSVVYQTLENAAALPPINPSSRNGYSDPFTIVVEVNKFRDRYFLEHSTNQAKPNQPTPTGRWIYAQAPAFYTYRASVSTTPYTYSLTLTTNNPIQGNAVSLDTWGQNIVISDSNNVVKYKQVDGSVYGAPNSTSYLKLSSSFINSSTALDTRLYPYDPITKNDIIDLNFPGCNYGAQVKMTRRNIVVTYPLSGQIFVYSRNERRPLESVYSITKTKVLSALFPNAGGSIAFVNRKNKNGVERAEYLAVASTSATNDKVQFWQNNLVSTVKGINGTKIPFSATNTLSTYAYHNRWSTFPSVITYSQATTGSFGYKLAFITPDLRYNKLSDFLLVSEPFKNRGGVHVYRKDHATNSFIYMTMLSSASARNYGAGLCTAGPYTVITGPRTVLQNVTGVLVDVYRVSTSKGRTPVRPPTCPLPTKPVDRYSPGVPSNNWKTLPGPKRPWFGSLSPLSASAVYYDLKKVDTFFIPNSGDLGFDVDMISNIDTVAPFENIGRNYFGDNLVITGNNITFVYNKCVNKFELLCTLSGATVSRIWDNNIYQINNNSNVIRGNFAKLQN
jgi:hypothetical protein